MKEKCYGYLRISTTEQLKRGFGLAVQKDQIKKYCTDNKLELIKIFEDDGFSGADLNRPGLQEMLVAVKNNGIKKIILAHSSRLARDAMLAEIIYRDLRRHGIEILSVSQPGYYESEGDYQKKLIRTILDAFDEYEKSLIAYRLKAGKLKKVQNGGWHGGNVFGYCHKNKRLVVDAEEAEVVKKIYYLKRYRKQNPTRISEILNKEKVPTKRPGMKWYPFTVRKILRNPIYRGFLRYQGKVYQGNHEAILK